MFRYLFLIIIISANLGFTSKPKCTEKTIKNLYSVCIPLNMSELKGLNPEASLQYYNGDDNIFIVILEEPLTDLRKVEADYSLSNYLNFAIKNMGDLNNRVVGTPESISIGGVSALQSNISGAYDGTAYNFRLIVLQGKTHMFQILVWHKAGLKEKKKKAVNDMVMSFRLV